MAAFRFILRILYKCGKNNVVKRGQRLETNISFDWPGPSGRRQSVAVSARRDLNGWQWTALLLQRGRVIREFCGTSAYEASIVADCKASIAAEMSVRESSSSS